MSTCAPRNREDLIEMARAVADLDRQQVAKVLSDARNKQPGSIYWTWVNGLISGPITHAKYIAANATYALTERGVTTPIAAIIGGVKKVLGVEADRVFFGETAAGLHGGIAAIPEAFMTAARSVKTGMRPPLEGEVALRDAAIARGDKVKPTLERTVNPVTGLERPINGVWGRIIGEKFFGKTGGDVGQAIGKAAGRIIGVPGDAAGAIHTFFKVMGYRAGIEAEAYRMTVKDGYSMASDPDAFTAQWAKRSASPTEEMHQTAVDEAYKGTFMQELGPHGKKWSMATKSNPWLKWIFPFAHIPINLMKATYEHTPLAMLDGDMRANIMGEHGGIAQDKAIARMVVGSGVMAFFTHKALNGQVTGDYPLDPKERDQWKLTGKQPNSILIGNHWESFAKFGPAGNLANLGANLGSVLPHLQDFYKGEDEEGMTKATMQMANAAGRMVSDEVGFQSLANLFEAIHDEKKGTAFVASQASSLVPFSSFVSQTASFMDPDMRQAKTFIDGLKYRIPGLREELLPKRDWSGQPVANPGYHNIIREREANADPLDLEMARLSIHPAPPQDRIGGVKLPPQMYDQYQVTAGAFTRSMANHFVNQPGWANLPAFVREDTLKNIISSTRQSAAATIQMGYPQVLMQGVADRMAKINGDKPPPKLKDAP
jgi:hypothetical protein